MSLLYVRQKASEAHFADKFVVEEERHIEGLFKETTTRGAKDWQDIVNNQSQVHIETSPEATDVPRLIPPTPMLLSIRFLNGTMLAADQASSDSHAEFCHPRFEPT